MNELVINATLAAAINRARYAPQERLTPHGFETPAQRKAALDDPVPETVQRPKVLEIKRVVANYYSVEVMDIDSDRRDKCIIRPRHMVAYLAKVLTALSLLEIGRRIGNRDHSTIHYSIKKMEAKIVKDAVLAQEVKELKLLILGVK